MTRTAVVDKWSPDRMLVDAILADPNLRTMADLPKGDREWVVAGLRRAGMTANEIHDRLRPCARRLVITLMGEPMTALAMLYMEESEAFAEETRMLRSELSRLTAVAAEAAAEAERTREQLGRMIDMAMTGERITVCRNQHVQDKYTVYVHPKTGKRGCRKCRHDAVVRCRSKSNGTVITAQTGP